MVILVYIAFSYVYSFDIHIILCLFAEKLKRSSMRSQATQTDQASSSTSFGKSLPHLASYDKDDDSVSTLNSSLLMQWYMQI